MIEKAFQLPFDEVFEEFEHTPIGTGAIAQVKNYPFYEMPFALTTVTLNRFIEPL